MRSRTGINTTVIILAVAFFSLAVVNRTGINDGVPEQIESFHKKYPQQKVFISMDKEAYKAGDDIWFKVYLVNATTHEPTGLSRNLIVEINNTYGQNIMTRLCKIENGFSHGDFVLPDTISQGIYELRAYTNWMRNFGEEFFFRRQFNIWNPEHAPKIYRDDKIANRKLKRKSIRKAGKSDVQFFPEGGDLVAGIKSRVAFKAVNELGLGIDVSGTIYDKKNNEVARFSSEHLGMGYFEFTPDIDAKYTAHVTIPGGKTERIKLPEVKAQGFSMQVDNLAADIMKVNLSGTGLLAELTLVGHVRGDVHYNKDVTLTAGKAEIEIDKSPLPEGIFHLTLFDRTGMPRCERLAFINHNERLNISIDINEPATRIKEEVGIKLNITDANNEPVEGNFNLSVADRSVENLSSDFQSNIVSNLLLSSDLKGNIEQPDSYFNDNSRSTRQKLEYLMLTHGWRRFRWDHVLEVQSMQIQYPIERGLEISGRITRELFDLPLKNLPVTLTILSEFNDVYITRTNSDGEFNFELPDYQDTISAEITARRLSGRKNLVIHIDQADQPEGDILYSSYTKGMTIQGSTVYRPSEEPEEDTTQVINEGIHRTADHVIKMDENLRTYNSVFEVIQGRVAGVQVSGNNAMIRGPSSFLGSNEPLYLVDNVPVDAGAVASINPMDVDRIEILKGPTAAIYGIRGANGVIAIYTRRGSFQKKGVLDFKMHGYHKAREFYSPRYGTDFDYLVEDDRTTVFWSPMVTTDQEGNAAFSFYHSDAKGTFRVKVEGISNGGTPGFAETKYEVN